MSEIRYDVAVVGGGPAGSLCALRLARLGWRVLLADRPHSRPVEEGIPEMLAPEGVWLLERLGLSSALDGQASVPCRGILSYWDAEGPELSDLALFRLRPGKAIDRRRFDDNLRELADLAGADVRRPAQVDLLGPRGADPVRLRLRAVAAGAAVEMTASFLVEATGRGLAAGIATDGGARKLHFDRLVAIPLRTPAPLPSDGLLRIVPSSSGWWYTVAMEGVAGVAVYLTDGDLLPRQPAILAAHLQREQHDAVEAVCALGACGPGRRGVRLLRDARTGCRRALWRGSWLPIADSAFTVDPLSGSGLTRGLRMADRAADAIDHYLATGGPGELSRFAIASCEEFAATYEVGRRLYARCAQRFPDSEFWRRRSGEPHPRRSPSARLS